MALYCIQRMAPQNRSLRFPVKILDISYRYRFLQCFFFSVYTVKKTVAIFFRFAIIISSYFITGRHSTSVVYQLPKLRRRVRFPLSAYSKKHSEIKNALILLGFHMFKIFLFRKNLPQKVYFLRQSIPQCIPQNVIHLSQVTHIIKNSMDFMDKPLFHH